MDATEKPQPRRTTLKDIAKRLDVSHATVSRALNRQDDPFISVATRERVRQAALEMGYRPNLAARSLATGRTGHIALWLDDTSSNEATVTRFLHAEACRRKYQLVVNYVSPEGPGKDSSQGDAWHVDGVIAHEVAPAVQAYFPEPGLAAMPIVSTGAVKNVPGVDRVTIDLATGTDDAIRHLVEAGRQRIAYVAGDAAHALADARYHAYSERLVAAGLEPTLLRVEPGRAGVRTSVRSHYETQRGPDALFCHNDDIAIAAYRGLCDLGIRVPDDVAIVGCDGIEDTEYLEVPLTTISQPIDEMCRLAIQFLEDRIADPNRPVQEARLTATLVIRSSTGGTQPPPYRSQALNHQPEEGP